MAETKDFFISYTKADRDWAEWVAWELQEAGYTCIIQAWHFAPSQSFVQRMRQALVETRHLVAILSNEYLASEFAGAELDAALAADPRGLRAKLIPIRVKPCTPDELPICGGSSEGSLGIAAVRHPFPADLRYIV